MTRRSQPLNESDSLSLATGDDGSDLKGDENSWFEMLGTGDGAVTSSLAVVSVFCKKRDADSRLETSELADIHEYYVRKYYIFLFILGTTHNTR